MDHKDFKKFCQEQRCMICNSQLDGGIYTSGANLYCVSNQEEFSVSYFLNKRTGIVEKSYNINIDYYPNRYNLCFSKDFGSGEWATSVFLENLEFRKEIRRRFAKLLFIIKNEEIPFLPAETEELFKANLNLYMIFA